MDMEAMTNTVKAWKENPVKFARTHGVNYSLTSDGTDPEKEVHLLIVEGFLIYNDKLLKDLFDHRFFLAVPYEESKRRRSSRTYTVPDPPGLFDGHCWPMYLKHRKEMEETVSDIEYLDGLKSRDELFTCVYEKIQNTFLNCS
ncbi:nicotinamide riboside kinase 2 isoform X2 [Protopterus annectens]|nr:nicotinamide riboside kinase 2 isoform X2 [Protopterus annectens]